MLRKALIAFGVFEILRPQPVIDACERIGLENPAEATLRPHAHSLARLEGVLVVWVLVRGRRKSPLVSAVLAVMGMLAILAPRPLIRLSQLVAYENPAELELKPWIVPATRLLGALYLLVVVVSGTGEDPGTTAPEKSPPAESTNLET